jgi:hypothetical protein
MPRLNEDQRNNTIGRLQTGETQTQVSRVLNVPLKLLFDPPSSLTSMGSDT